MPVECVWYFWFQLWFIQSIELFCTDLFHSIGAFFTTFSINMVSIRMVNPKICRVWFNDYSIEWISAIFISIIFLLADRHAHKRFWTIFQQMNKCLNHTNNGVQINSFRVKIIEVFLFASLNLLALLVSLEMDRLMLVLPYIIIIRLCHMRLFTYFVWKLSILNWKQSKIHLKKCKTIRAFLNWNWFVDISTAPMKWWML